MFAEHVPSETAVAVALLEQAGYADVGKANLHEFAYGVTSQNLHYGTVPNPVAPGRTAGGSSGGSAAAIAAGLAEAALGTDTGGSIRIPAACCGVVGFKPSYGLVSTDGVFPLAPSFDHAGPMAGDVASVIAMMAALVPGFEVPEVALDEIWAGLTGSARQTSARPRPPRARSLLPPAARDARAAARRRPPAGVHARGRRRPPRALCRAPRALRREHRTEDRALPRDQRRRGSPRRRTARGLPPGAHRGQRALRPRARADLAFVAPAADVDEIAVRERFTRFTFPFNALGWPALALPCGPAEDGLPASIQLIGRAGDDALVLAAGLALEDALSGH